MDKLKNLFNRLKASAKSLKKEVKTLYLAYKRPDVPWHAKLFSILVIGYALSPIDLIPDFVPIFGYIDDLVLIPLGVSLAIKMIPRKIVEECRVQAEDVFKDGKPKNWVAGAAIISIWIVVICFIIFKVLLRL
ncbi:YkvA family protein [Thermoanaerobacterium saccharolyticum]|uniref:YkvA family protein n=1 Tax=Thermoanaerobacterium saccharolyticum TaxID=28896 RepID=UPI002FD9554C